MSRRILFVSNCFGEDRSAAYIARELQNLLCENNIKDMVVNGASLISEAADYQNLSIPVISSSWVPPSGGFPTKSIKGFFKDVFSDSFKSLSHFSKNLKQYQSEIVLTVVVGDIFLLWLTKRALPKSPLVFIFLPKSDYIEPYYGIENWYIKKSLAKLLTRDAFTAENLTRKGIKAEFLGNPIMDGLEMTQTTIPLIEGLPVLGILPGSREEAYENLMMAIGIAERVYEKGAINIVAALPNTLSEENIYNYTKEIGWDRLQTEPYPILSKGDCEIILTKRAFAEVLQRCDAFIGLAGTANEQAAGLGKPIVTFKGSGPQTTKTRFIEQNRLLGDASYFVEDYPDRVVDEVFKLLNDPSERSRRGAIGKARMGDSGASCRIAKMLYRDYLKE